MFEPVYGFEPDIAGKGIANPAAAVWAGAMILEHLGETGAADALVAAMAKTFANKEARTADLGGATDTEGSVAAVLSELLD